MVNNGSERRHGPRAPSSLPLYYFAFAHLSLATACLFLAHRPSTFVGFYYHPAMMAPVHLVTLGWITASILGALYMIAPMALRTRLAEGRLHRLAFWSFAVGVAGMVGHFWIDSYGGMVWSAGLVVAAVLVVGASTARAVVRAPVALGVRLHLLFAFVNLVVAGIIGLLIGLGRDEPVLPGFVLGHVHAHAHLAAVGWAIMMVFGAAYRLLPMLLPAAMPSGWGPVASALLLEGGVVGLAISFELAGGVGGRGLVLSAGAVTAAFVVFAGQVVWMLRHRRPRAAGLPHPDLGLVHVAQALAYALLTLTIGLVLALADLEPASRLRLVPVYGVFGLLGFLAQMVIGVELRLLPLYGWLRRYAAAGAGEPPPPPYTAASGRLQIATLVSWTLGVPLLATALYFERATLLAVAAWLLLLATVASAWQGLRCARSSTSPQPGRSR